MAGAAYLVTTMATELSTESFWSALQPTPASYLKMAREINAGRVEGLRAVNVAVLSTFTSEILSPYVTVECARRELDRKSVV